ncbi:hypothetical protein [uncultured Maritimibacter sp.]|jgi:maleylpyruvate isomerase|uniref:hypothetical protein n=1 Tax=uncultured Maritimibacter sp. TaxID=991866 RepID=UPI000A6054B5|nr:hypothetical protein [uncultured Maritimibacter sp.]
MSMEEARRALIERQGTGARYDAANAPRDMLLQVRRRTSAFARVLNDTPDDGLRLPGDAPEASGAFQVAKIALEARQMSLFCAALREGAVPPTLDPKSEDLRNALTLPPRALRHLFDHTAVHLNVEWRDLGAANWDSLVECDPGGPLAVQSLPDLRDRSLEAALNAMQAVARSARSEAGGGITFRKRLRQA